MKKIFSLLFPLAILTSGCEYEELQNKQLDSQDGRIFTASFEQSETRTYVENGSLLRWNAGDQISLFDGNTLNRQYQFDGETGDNAGTFSIVNKPFGTGNDLNCHYAVYPYASDVKITESGVITTYLPAEQKYVENSFGLGDNTMVAVTKDIDDTYLKFKNTCGYLKLELYGDDEIVKSITLTGNSNEKIAGKAAIMPTYSEEPKVTMSEEATSSITLNCGEGVMIGEIEESATAFWIVVPPTTFDTGFTITITDINDNTFTKSTSNKIDIIRNFIKPMKPFEVKIENEIGDDEGIVSNNQILYTSTEKVETNISGIVSNIWNAESGKGIITFNKAVTKIEDSAFSGCSSLISVSIGNEVVTIGDYAFRDCNNLTSVTLGNSVTTIGIQAFLNCSSLTSIIIPDSVTTIGGMAFRDSGLTNVTIPDNVTTIGNSAFMDCDSLTGVTIGSGVTTIESSAFANCDNLTNIIIPDNVTTIGDSVFYFSNSLTSVTIGNGVTTIGSGTFRDCNNLTSITIGNKVNEIGDMAFLSCYNLTSVQITDITSWCNISFGSYDSNPLSYAKYLYLNNELVVDLIIPDNVTKIKDYAFYNCYSLTKITIPDSVTLIGESAFDCCINLTSANIPNNAKEIGYRAFNGCGYLNNLEIPNGVTTIGGYAFCGCNNLTNIAIPNSVTEIEEYTFYSCGSLTSVSIANSVTTIGESAFAFCRNLENASIPEGVTSIEERAFYITGLTSVTIPNGVTSIGSAAFSGCNNLEEFKGKFASADGCCIVVNGTLVSFAAAADIEEYNIPNNVTQIGYEAFEDCRLTSVTIPDSVTTIDNEAFHFCGITTVTIGDGVKEIGDSAFSQCYNLKNVTLGERVSKIGNYVFSACYELTSIFCKAPTPPEAGEILFERNLSDLKISVPTGSVDAYKSCFPWSVFASDIVGYNF